MKKRIIYIIFFLALLLSTSELFSQQERTIRVGVYNNYPKVYITDQGDVLGIYPELLDYIAFQENWNIEYIEGTWNEGLQRLENAEIDLMVDVAFSEERQEKYDFNNETILINWGCIYTKSRQNVNSIFDLNGKSVAVMKESIHTTGEDGIYKLVDKFAVKCSFVEANDYYEVFDLIKKGEVDAGVVNRIFGADFEDKYGVKKTNFIFNPIQLRFAFPKNVPLSEYLITAIDENLEAFQKNTNSIYYTILARYNLYPKKGIPNWLIPLIIGFIIITIFFILMYLLMKWRIKQQTRALKSTNEVLKQEITEHQTTLRELALSRENYRNFVENIPGLVYMYDQDEDGTRTPVITTNRNEEFLGKEVAQKIEKNYSNFFDHILPEDKEKMQKLSEEVLNTGEAFHYEYRVRINDKKIKWFRSIGRVKLLPNGKRRWQGVILDIDQRKKAENELELYRNQLEELVKTRTEDLEKKTKELEKANIELKEADKLKSIFLASMSHELRTPLNSIIGFTGILLMGMVGELSDEQKTQLKIVKNSANHLLELINDILDISKIEAGKVDLHKETFMMNDIITEVLETFKHSADDKGLELTIHFDENIEIYTDLRRFKQVIINLVGNAIKFTDQGSVSVITELKDSGVVDITVKDTGVGIKKEDMGKLFEPFQQVDSELTKKREGTGLGLHLTQKIMNLLNGKIHVDSIPREGTTFILTFPHIIKDHNNEESISN